jgi:hypothetical protein
VNNNCGISSDPTKYWDQPRGLFTLFHLTTALGGSSTFHQPNVGGNSSGCAPPLCWPTAVNANSELSPMHNQIFRYKDSDSNPGHADWAIERGQRLWRSRRAGGNSRNLNCSKYPPRTIVTSHTYEYKTKNLNHIHIRTSAKFDRRKECMHTRIRDTTGLIILRKCLRIFNRPGNLCLYGHIKFRISCRVMKQRLQHWVSLAGCCHSTRIYRWDKERERESNFGKAPWKN